MNKLYILLLVSFLAAAKTEAQTCMGKHNDNFLLLASQGGVDFYYRINHCPTGDEILLQITNNNAINVNVGFTKKVFSANQVSPDSAPVNISVNAQSTINANACSLDPSPLQIVGVEVFTNEIPMQLMKLEINNITIQ